MAGVQEFVQFLLREKIFQASAWNISLARVSLAKMNACMLPWSRRGGNSGAWGWGLCTSLGREGLGGSPPLPQTRDCLVWDRLRALPPVPLPPLLHMQSPVFAKVVGTGIEMPWEETSTPAGLFKPCYYSPPQDWEEWSSLLATPFPEWFLVWRKWKEGEAVGWTPVLLLLSEKNLGGDCAKNSTARNEGLYADVRLQHFKICRLLINSALPAKGLSFC